MKTEEEHLLQRIRKGDPLAERELLTLFGARIARKVMSAIGPQNNDWKDVANDVMLAVLVNLRDGKFDAQRGAPLGSYIYGVVNNKIRDYYKLRKKLRQTLTLDKNIDFCVAEEFEIEKNELRKVMRKMLKELKDKYQQVLFLRYYEEMSVAEISEQIGLPPRRVSERLNYAVKLLQKQMKKKKYFSIFNGVILIIV